MYRTYVILFILSAAIASPAQARSYHLDIARKEVNVTGTPVNKITINESIPGPTLRFTEGEEAVIAVTNHMDEETSVHWHGLLLDGAMDGVPGLNGFPGIKPGETFTYTFRLRQNGTYWYHAHSVGQEQDGHYGSIVITPKGGESIRADRDYVLVLSDFSEESSEQILANLKMDSAYYNYHQRTVGDVLRDVQRRGNAAWRDVKDWGTMRMSPTDLADVSGYTFLINGKTPDENWTGLFTPGEKVRLRIINASSMSFFDVRIPGLKLRVVAADGQPVEPVMVDEFRIAPAETYDVIVSPNDDGAYTIAAEPIDRTGFALGTLAPREGMQGAAPKQRKRALLTMADMNMDVMMKGDPDMDMTHMHGIGSGWAEAGTPEGHRALDYKDLRYAGTQRDTRKPNKEITVRLGGSMERYIWTINDKTYSNAAPISVKYGDRVKLTFVNETMMAHPMHLHGMFVQPINGQPADKLPSKHTVFVPPGQSYSVLLTADEAGEWAFHCHLLYHMLSGMMTHLVVDKNTITAPETPPAPPHPHHAH